MAQGSGTLDLFPQPGLDLVQEAHVWELRASLFISRWNPDPPGCSSSPAPGPLSPVETRLLLPFLASFLAASASTWLTGHKSLFIQFST